MLISYSKAIKGFNRSVATAIIISILFSLVPFSAFAEEPLPPNNTSSTTSSQATSTPQTTTSTSTSTPPTTPTNISTTTATSSPSGSNATSTGNGTNGGTGNGQNGINGTSGTTTATTTATSTPQGPNGQTGGNGAPGASAGATPNDEVTPVEVISDPLLGDIDAPEEEETTGDIRTTGIHALIETGIATAQGELSTDANSNEVRSELDGATPLDYDTYTFVATGTNDAIITNDGLARSTSGDNYARGRSTSKIVTGDSVAAFNIANVINTNVINSDGFIYLANNILTQGQSLDLTSAFFPDPATEEALSNTCSLLSCVAEDVVYNVSQVNNATVTNNALIEAVTGYNQALGDLSAEITTGDAYATGNVLNVVNSNIIDSNYRLFTYNAIGDLDGDLVLPTGEHFEAFFGRANGISASENDRQGKYEDFNVHVNNLNDAVIDNNLDAYAETGLNESTTDFPSSITTGIAESESNTLNKINENTYGGDSMYMLIRVHGVWSGDVIGLPEGLAWEWTPQGIVVYNEDAEVTPSEFMSTYDLDSYTANFDNNNKVALENNITINAITGENEIGGLVGTIKTGDAFASANVMNIANTNIIGTNWTFAVINILGDFDGNVSFAATDIALTGNVSFSENPLGPNDILTYSYTITNHSNTTATNVVLNQTLQKAHTSGNATTQSVSLGTIASGASKQTTLSAVVDGNIPNGTSSVVAYASILSDQGDENVTDNLLMLSANAFRAQTTGGGTGTTTGGTGTTTNNNTGTTTNNGTSTPPTYSQANYYAQGTYSSGGGGGGGGGSDTKVDRAKKKPYIDPASAPLLSIKKVALNIGKDDAITAGESVDYKITVTNDGGNAYDAQVFDILKNPIDSVMNEQSWDLGTILPGESIDLTYTTEYNFSTPSGKYTNTASIKAYAKDGMKEKNEAPLKIKDAVYVVVVKGVDLAVGNVAVLAYFPGVNGKTSALVSWETSKPSVSQLFYGVTGVTSPYNEKALNLGYQNSSFKFPDEKVKHVMIITGLEPGRTHSYRIHATNGKFKATSREYNFTIPAVVARLTLPGAPSAVAGASTSAVPPVAPATKYVPPAPKLAPTPAVAPAPTSVAPAQGQGGVKGFVKSVFGLFR